MSSAIHEDAFNLLCGEKIGEGVHRTVFACRLRPELVVKVEQSGDWRYFANVHEMKMWSDNADCKAVARWLAPCEYMSPDGRILLQRRVEPLRKSDRLPKSVPEFLTDIKPENFGLLDGRIVCADYAITIPASSLKRKKVDWR